jgi:hypothetical protein
MQSGNPPPESRDPLSSTELDAARGTLREALSALRNFAELLHSLRVGSKALISVLPDVAEGCAPLRMTVDGLLHAVAARSELAAASAALQGYFAPRLVLLDEELAHAGDRPLSAKSRLGLEQVITRSSLELDTARGLLDLCVEAVSGRLVPVALAGLVQQTFAGPPSGGSWNRRRITATLSCQQSEIEVALNPRIATALVAFGVELVAGSGQGTPRVLVDRDASGRSRVTIERGPISSGDDLILIARGVIEPTLPCLFAIAEISGVSLSWDPQAPRWSVSFPDRQKALRNNEAS